MTRGEYIYQRRKYFLDLIEKSKIKFDDVGKVDFYKSVPKRLPNKIAIHCYTQKLKKSLARSLDMSRTRDDNQTECH